MDGSQENPFSVTALTSALKTMIEGRFAKIFVEAEISGWKVYPSGHAYFTLKDAGAQISAVMFASSYQACLSRHPGIGESLKDGTKVLVYGGCSVYPPKGNYQLVVRAMKPVGEGDLMQRYLELKAKLEKEGLFDSERKRKLPFLPRRIGIVTSEAGAVIHDMCNVLTRRFPALEIRLRPALVQGAEAPASMIDALRYFNSEENDWWPDLVILARGGGSFEDLFCFNDEELVRTVAACRVPIISAVGHETDFTLCDFAADVRAGTPSIAAEIAVPVLSELRDRLADAGERCATALRRRGEFAAQRIDHLADSLAATLSRAAVRAETRIVDLSGRLRPVVELAFTRASARLEKTGEKLELLSPYGVLDRGYAMVLDRNGHVVRRAASVAVGDQLNLRLADGAVGVTVSGDLP